MADFVLIHGTTQTPRGWDRLTEALRSRGHRAVAVDLAGSDERSITGYAEEIRRQAPAELHAPIVVAHSGTGPVLPAAAGLLGAQRQVWLAAIVPDGRRPLLQEIRSAPTEIFNPEWPGKDPTADPVLAGHFLFHDCDLETLQWALTTLRLFAPAALYADPVTLLPSIPSSYVLATQDRTLRPTWCRRAAEQRLGAEVIEIDAGHCPHVSRPSELADILDRLTVAAAG
ncbi:alpha/beta fold hydrolase [Nakamurella lactea]|uniref:alpha/beta fold hydrolase n=1 Tax=Nakamurella lactea TaxID=459515 RepID=UPI00040E97C9|nr:alpha/beta hydrolase [Nakamurella lactea]